MTLPQGIRTQQDIEQIETADLATHNLPQSTYEALSRGAARNPEAPALSFFLSAQQMDNPYVLSHGQLLARVTQTANALRRLGIGRDDVVAYVLPNLPETHFTIWGGSAAGSVLAINPLLDAEQIGELLAAAGTKVLITLEQSPGVDIWEKVSVAARAVPSLEHVLVCGFGPYVAGDGVWRDSPAPAPQPIDGVSAPVTRLLDEIAQEDGSALGFEAPGPNDTSTMLCTGGTTGLPKIVRRTHFSEVYNSWAASLYSPDAWGPGRTAFCGLPLFHTNAMMVTGLLPWMSGGHVLLATPGGYRGQDVIARFWDVVERYKVSMFSGVPTIYGALLQVPRDGRDLSSVQFGLCGAAPMPVELFNSFVAETGIKIVEAYGMTEGAVGSSLNPIYTDAPRVGSIGLRFPYQQMAIAIMDDNDTFERWADVDEAGVILISGPNVFNGYLIDSQNKGIWVEQDGKRWFNSGDLARRDAEGYFWMTGRKKELIIRGGHNIDPKIVEEVMHKHPAVAMAAVVGRPDAKVGEVPVMYFQVAAGQAADVADLAEFAATHVHERAAVPKDYIVLDALPVTAVGKIHKVSLNMMEIERAVRTEAEATGADLASVEVVQDSARGVVAKAVVASGLDALQKSLGQYAFACDLQQAAQA
ncbi:MAG: acyl-CoA synthetase [Marinibacterium sp.]|nr:acyl-CoA synthetase [Marinibacterium sp.]